MAGDPICCSYYDSTCITPTQSTNSSTNYYSVSWVNTNVQVSNKNKKELQKELKKERADKLHRQSFVLKHEIKPKIFKMIGQPFNNFSKPYHANYALGR